MEFIGKNGTMKVIPSGQMRNLILAMIRMEKVDRFENDFILDTIESKHYDFQVHVQFHLETE